MGSAGPFKGAIAAVRAAFVGQPRTTTTFKSAAIPVSVNGVGFWDDIHGQTGVARNGKDWNLLDVGALKEGLPHRRRVGRVLMTTVEYLARILPHRRRTSASPWTGRSSTS